MLRGLYLVAASSLILGVGTVNAAMVAHFDFNETAGTTLNDSAGTADGTTTDVAFSASGAGILGSGLGNAGAFNGATSVVDLGEPASLDLGTGDFTISGWFKMPTNTVTGVFGNKPVLQSIDYAGGGWAFEVGRADRSYGGEIFFTVGGGSGSVFSQTQVFSDTRVDDDTWHWIAVTNSGGAINMYIDGVLQVDTGVTTAGTSTATSPAGTMAQFAARGTAQALFEGSLDEWGIYDEALSGTLDSNNTLTGGDLYDAWQVPEPASMILVMTGAVGLLARRRGS